MSEFAHRLRRGDRLLGSFSVELPAAAVPEALAQSGFDFLVVDTEHSAYALSQVASLVVACRAAGIASVVRVSDHSRAAITRAADMAPDALMVPGVETAGEAGAIVERAKYAPLGTRGVCPMVRYSGLSGDRYATLNDTLALILQVEGPTGLRNGAEIASVAGVDALFVGPYDLSHALGLPAPDHPDVLAAGAGLRGAMPAAMALGVYATDGAMAAAWLGAGASFVTYGTDAQLFLAACRSARESIEALVG
jgi:4-hydroxy-2-oxoheptanedioate aldolase